MRKIFPWVLTTIVLVTVVLAWNATQSKIVIESPSPNQTVGVQITLSGIISSTLLEDDAFIESPIFKVEIIDGENNLILGRVLEVHPLPWYGQFIAIPIHFETKLDTSGMTTDTPTCFGKATLSVSSLKNETFTASVPVHCEPGNRSE